MSKILNNEDKCYLRDLLKDFLSTMVQVELWFNFMLVREVVLLWLHRYLITLIMVCGVGGIMDRNFIVSVDQVVQNGNSNLLMSCMCILHKIQFN